MELLENPMWHALTGPQAAVAVAAGRARRLPADLAPFGALPDDPTPDDWRDLGTLLAPGETVAVFRPDAAPPEGWTIDFRFPAVQMVGDGVESAPCPGAVELGPDDVEDMLALTHETKPGPFRRRTRELGCYLGVRDGGRLVALTGERLRPPGHVEISAVCTADSHRRSGLAAALVRDVVGRIQARGDVPILHVMAENTSAIALYEKLGFRRSRVLDVIGVRRA